MLCHLFPYKIGLLKEQFTQKWKLPLFAHRHVVLNLHDLLSILWKSI